MPPSDDLRDSSALRQEGPQQDMWLVFEERSALWWGPRSCGYTDLLRAGLYSEEDAKRIANNPSRRDRAVRLADKLREIEQLEHGNERVLAALSASRTAQAPQQELARTTLICAAHMLDACAENMEKLCVGYGAEQMRGIAQRLREGTPTLEQACAADDLKKAQARIQVLETSVDYLRNLVDHPVTQGGMGVHRPVLNGNHRSILVDRDADVRREMRAYLDTLTIHGDNIGDIRRSLFMPFDSQWNGWVRDDTAEREISVPPPVAPAEGEQ